MYRFLHISDIHRTSDEPVSNDQILLALSRDLQETLPRLGVKGYDGLVISGDFVQSAEPKEYREAEQMIRELLEIIELTPSELTLVPGNHDVHWPTISRQWRGVESSMAHPADLSRETEDGRWIVQSEPEYQQRLAHFREFHERLTRFAYPVERERAFSVSRPCRGVVLVGFSSVDLNDDHRFEGSIHPGAIKAAQDEIRGFDGLRIAVWHHDLNWRGARVRDALAPESLDMLGLAGFDLGLCGHSHRSSHHDLLSIGPVPLPVVASGSLCAGPLQRPESLPRLYNIIEVNGREVTLRCRRRDTATSPWRTETFPNVRGEPRDKLLFRLAEARSEPHSPPSAAEPLHERASRLLQELGAFAGSPSRVSQHHREMATIYRDNISHLVSHIARYSDQLNVSARNLLTEQLAASEALIRGSA